MKKFLQLIIIVAIFAVAFHFRFEINQKFHPYIGPIEDRLGLTHASIPCAEPIQYTLGSFDTKFGISKDYFISALSQAEAIWEKPAGKNLFDYNIVDNRSDTMKINLIYDYRQQATSKLNNLGIVVENNRASFESLKTKFESLKIEYEQQQNDYNARVTAFNRGDRKNISEYNNLQNEEKNLNSKAEEINAMVVALNRLIASLNLSVEKFNSTNDARGESFEEGVYTSDGLNRQIDIYEFSNHDKLVRVLAHELGHALELDHVADPKAIMYELNESDSLNLTHADIVALEEKCQLK